MDLLCQVLARAATYAGTNRVDWQGLRTLARCAASCKILRTAVELAIRQCELHLFEVAAPPPSLLRAPGVHRWVQRCKRLWLGLDSQGPLSNATEDLRSFMEECEGERGIHARLHGRPESLATLRCESALASCDCLQQYSCTGFLPTQFAAQLRSLEVSNLPAAPSLEALFVQLQNCCWLQELSLNMRCTPLSSAVQLRASELAGIQLHSLRKLELCVILLSSHPFDASWLKAPRAFALRLSIGDEGQQLSPAARLYRLQILLAVLQEHDTLVLCSLELTDGEQLALGQLRLAACEVFSDTGTLLHLPHTPRLSVCLMSASTRSCARLAWAAISKSPGVVKVDVEPELTELEVLGCDSREPPLFEAAGWQLTVHSNGAQIRGCPALEDTGQGVFVLTNQAASSWPPAEPGLW